MANIYSLQLLRNGAPFSSYTAAVDAITGDTTRQDGILKLARYTSNESDSAATKYNTSTVKTIFGLYYKPASGDGSWTIFDSYHEVIQNIQNQIDSLTGGEGSIAQQIQNALDQLDFSGVTGNVVTGVEQTNGKVSATGANVGTLALTGYDEGTASGNVVATDSINAAIAKLQNQVKAANEAKDAAIEALDANITAENGFIIDHIEQVDGKISGTTRALPSLNQVASEGQAITAVSQTNGAVNAAYGDVAAAHVTVADADNLFSSSTVEATLAEIVDKYTAADAALKTEILGGASESANTLGKLEDIVNDLNADAATYTIRKDTESLPAGVKERYTLVETKNGTPTDKAVAIDIPKDSHIVSIEYISNSGDTHYQNLKYIYVDVNGDEQVVYVDMANLVFESEFKSGVTATNGIVHGVVDPNSEKDANNNPFLTVGADGFKVDGVKNAIAAASNDLKTALDALSGKTVTSVEMTGGTAAIAAGDNGTKKITINADGSTLKTSTAYTSAQTASAVAANDSIDTALGKLEAQVAAARAAATTKVEKDANASHITLTNSTAADGSVTYTIGENDIASKTDLDAEIAARKAVDGQNGQTYAANANTNYITGATSLNDADVKLDTALKTVADSANSAQTEIDAIETAVGLNADGTYNANTSNTYTNNASSVADAVNKLDAAVKDNADDITELSGKTVTGITMNGTGVTVTNNVAALTATYTNTAAEDVNGMVITTGANGGLTFQFGTLDCGEYN